MATIHTRAKTQKTLSGTVYFENSALPPGLLPSKKNVIECMLYLMRKDRAGKEQRTVQEGAYLLAHILIEHWQNCNIYTRAHKNVAAKIVKLYQEFKTNIQQRTSRQTESWVAKMKAYNDNMLSLFDIFCSRKVLRMISVQLHKM